MLSKQRGGCSEDSRPFLPKIYALAERFLLRYCQSYELTSRLLNMSNPTFWTARRLRELRSKARKLDLPELSKHFGKSEDSCRQALSFANAMKKMRVCKVKEIIHGKPVDVIKLECGYALYSYSPSDYKVGCSRTSNEALYE